MPLTERPTIILALAVTLLLAACTDGETPAEGEDPAALLAEAKATLDEADSVHVVVTSADIPPGSNALLSGEGTAARPSSFEGELEVSVGGGTVSVGVISVDGTVYVQSPFTPDYVEADPAQFGLRDPAELIDPETGVSNLLVAATGAELGEELRVDGEVVHEVTATIPGDVVQDLLASADPSTPVDAVFAIAQDNGQLRQTELTGPFYASGTDSTYTIVLDRYNEEVDISAPPGAAPDAD